MMIYPLRWLGVLIRGCLLVFSVAEILVLVALIAYGVVWWLSR